MIYGCKRWIVWPFEIFYHKNANDWVNFSNNLIYHSILYTSPDMRTIFFFMAAIGRFKAEILGGYIDPPPPPGLY